MRRRLWWRWHEWRADRDRKAGRVFTFDTPDEAIAWLRSTTTAPHVRFTLRPKGHV